MNTRFGYHILRHIEVGCIKEYRRSAYTDIKKIEVLLVAMYNILVSHYSYKHVNLDVWY